MAAQTVRMSDTGGVWLFGKAAPTPFGLGELRRLVRDFIFHKLPSILNRDWYAKGFANRPCSCMRCDSAAQRAAVLAAVVSGDADALEAFPALPTRHREAS